MGSSASRCRVAIFAGMLCHGAAGQARFASTHAPPGFARSRCGQGWFSLSSPDCPDCRYCRAAPCVKHKTVDLVGNFVVDKRVGFTWSFSCLPIFPSPARGRITRFVHFVEDGIIIAISQSGLRAVQVEALFPRFPILEICRSCHV